MLTELIIGESAFEKLADEWDLLATSGITNTPFQTHAYQKTWWQYLHPADATLYTITVRSDNQSLLAIGCFFLVDGAFHFNGCIEETDYLDLITSAEHAEIAWAAILDCLQSNPDTHGVTLDLCNIPAASPSRAILPRLSQARGFVCHEEQIEVCPVIPLTDRFETYLDGIDSKQRREINRKMRRAAGADVKLHVVGPEDDLHAEVDAFLELLQKSTFEKRDWLNEGRRAVFHATAESALADGSLLLMFLEVDGQKGATLFNFYYNNRIWVYNSGLDPDLYSGLSLGVVLTAEAIKYGIDKGATTFDFLRGNETYKYRFGAQDTAIYRLTIQPN